ncbi:MAG: T9SS C-terminal target domain-containing protein [Ignavibacteriae bacterium]|nr:MAG: T9SS C-terminal target domain-containing protein [Ignavibacteriota bacterium]
MRNLLFVLLISVLFSGYAYTQNPLKPFNYDVTRSASLPSDIVSSVDGAVILEPGNQVISGIVRSKQNNIQLDIPVSSTQRLTLVLTKAEVFEPYAKVVAGTDNGDKEISIKDKFVSYRGKIANDNNSLVSLTFFDDYVSGIITSKDFSYVIGKLTAGELSGRYILYDSYKMKVHHQYSCGTEAFEIPQRITELQKTLSREPKDYSTAAFLKTNMAIESDYDTYVHFGSSVENTSRYIISLVSSASAVYIRDVNVQLSMTYLRVWSTASDPYTGTTSGELLNEFRAYWNANMQSVPRTIAHYICTRPGGLGGIAWVDVLCSNITSGYGYAFSDIDGTFNSLPAYSWDLMVVCHETGHNFGSPHTHNCSWPGGPIDTCYVSTENNFCVTTAIPRVGTIMSYCHLNASIVIDFGPLPKNLIRTKAENAPCLSTNSGFYLATPNGGQIFKTTNNVYIIWGTSSSGNVNVEYTTNNGTSWNNIQTNVPAAQRYSSWIVPYIPTTTQAKVRVTESGNPSIGDMSDSTFQLRPQIFPFNMIAPPQLSRFYTSPGDTSRLYFTFSKAGTLPEIKYKYYLTKLDNSFIYSQPSNNTGSDSLLYLRYSKIDSLMAAAGVQVNDSLRCKWFIRAFSQFDSTQSSTSSFLITFIRQIVGVQPISSQIPKEFFINQNYPNPFNPSTKIRFGLPKAADVKITIYDISGRVVSELVNGKLEAGEFETEWNATNYASGIYFYRIEAGDYTNTMKMLMVK